MNPIQIDEDDLQFEVVYSLPNTDVETVTVWAPNEDIAWERTKTTHMFAQLGRTSTPITLVAVVPKGEVN